MRPKLTATKVRRIKSLLQEGQMTHQQIADKYKISRTAVSKINCGMKDPNDKNGRWGDFEL